MEFRSKIYSVLFIFFTGFAFAQQGGIKGKVLEGEYPLPGAAVEIADLNLGGVTDFDGNFVITGLNEGRYVLSIRYMGFTTKQVEFTIKASEMKDLGQVILESEVSGLEEVVVRSARRLSEAKAINLQKNSLNIKNVIASDGIGKLPDRNAAEAVQRVAGVSIERDQGEGRYVAVRGLPSNWSSATMNGNRIPTGADEGGSRSTAFDFFPTEMIGYVEVSKALTPDIEADAIGGSVNFITKTAPSRFTLNATLGAGVNAKSEKGMYSGNFLIGDKTEDGKFGYLLNVSQWNRNWASDNFEARRSGDFGVYRLELRDYVGERKTTGLNGAIEFNPGKRTKLYTKFNYGTLADTEIHYKHRIRFDKYNETTGTGRVELQNIYNDLIFEFVGGELGGKHFFNKGNLDWSLAHFRNGFRYGNIPDGRNNSYYVVKYQQNNVPFDGSFLEDRGNGPRAYWNEDGGKFDYKGNMFDFYGQSNFQLDANQMTFADLEFYKVYVKEKDNIIAAVNYELPANNRLTLKMGAKFRDKERIATFADEFYNWGGATAPTLAQESDYLIEQPGREEFLNELGTNIGSTHDVVLSTDGMINFYENNFANGNLVLNEGASSLLENGDGLGRNFTIREQHTSGYGMATYNISEKVTMLGGLRLSNTSSTVSGYTYEETTANPDGVLSEVEKKSNYLAVLPMVHLKYSPNNSTNLRAAVTRSFARPEFEFLAPGGFYLAADNEYSGGNPNVNPTFSTNFDLLGEYYFGELDVISAGVFYKSISDPIFIDTQQGDINGITGVQISQPRNGDNAWLFGAEFSGNKKLDFLPGFLSGFGIQANYTFTQSEFTIPGREGTTTLPRQADHLINTQLYYEKGDWNLRLAYNYKGAYVMEHGSGLQRDDLYYGDHSALDANATYKLTKNLMLFAEVNNLLNQPLEYYFGSPNRPAQVEFHGLRGQAGLKWSL